MVVLGFPSYHCSLLDWTSYSFFRFRGQRLTKMWLPDLLFARPVATSGWSEVLASAVKATEGALLTPSACTNSGQWDSLPELGRLLWNPAQDWGWQTPAVSLSSADTAARVLQCTFTLTEFNMCKAANNKEAPGIFCCCCCRFLFFLKRTVGASSYTADIFSAAWDEPEFADVMGWNDLELRPSILKMLTKSTLW